MLDRDAHPSAIHNEAVFIGAGGEGRFFPPVANSGGIQRLSFGLPIIEFPRNTNADGLRIRELKVHGHELRVWSLVMVMIVRERRREIGVLKAIGASNVKIVTQFVVEAITLTVLGSVIGIVLGVAAGNPITRLLVNNSTNTATTGARGGGGFRAFGGGLRNNLSSIHGVVGFSIIFYGLAAAVVIAVIGSSLASFFISKVRPAEVMRAE